MSYNEPRPFGFDPVVSYFDSAEAVWIDPAAEEIPFGEEPVHVSADGIAEEIAERRHHDEAKRSRPLAAVPAPPARRMLTTSARQVERSQVDWLEPDASRSAR